MKVKPNKRNYKDRTVTPEVLAKIISDIKKGSTQRHAAEANCVSESHFYELINQGICDFDHDIVDSKSAKLAESLRKIQRDEIIECRQAIKNCEKGHHGAEWTLEQVYWQDFGNNAQIKELSRQINELSSKNNDDE